LFLVQDMSAFYMSEAADHASASYEAVDAAPEFVIVDTQLKLGLADGVEMTLGYAQAVPTDYRREIFTPAGGMSVTQDYELNSMRDFMLAGRLRRGPFEPYFSYAQGRQKASGYAASYPDLRSYFSYIRTRFEEGRVGVRTVSDPGVGALSNLALLEGALLDAGQFDIDAGLGYDGGKLRRNVAIYFGGALISDTMYHDLEDHFTPGVRVSYGLDEGLEATIGVTYAPPYDYAYEYRRNNVSGLAITHGDYETRHELDLPIGLRYRPAENMEVSFTSDIKYAQQRLNYWQQATTGVVTIYPARKLKYLNTQPTVTLTYLFEQGREIARDAFSKLAGTLLAKGQCLLKFVFQRDVTMLDKSAGNGAQNKIDPYSVFQDPLDYYVAGSEYGTYFTGNTSSSATNVAPQNYGLFKFDALYGITDDVSAGIVVGYRTSSRFHHFTVGSSSAYDLQPRSYQLKPYWFFGIPCRWRPTENSLVTLDWHYVPRYRSTVGVSGQAENFEAKTDYHSVAVRVQVLF